MSNAVLFKTHLNDKATLDNLSRLSGVDNVVRLHDNTNVKVEDAYNFGYNDLLKSKLALAPEEAKSLLNNTMSDKVFQMWANGVHGAIEYYKKNPDHEYYWLIEYDVFFYGKWVEFFSWYSKVKDDALLIDLQSEKDNPARFAKYYSNFDDPKYWCFGPVMRLSNKMLEVLKTELESGTYSHFEILVPTIGFKHGLKVRDLNKATKHKVYNFRTMGARKFTPVQISQTYGGYNKLFHKKVS